jgi:hypothetical protein
MPLKIEVIFVMAKNIWILLRFAPVFYGMSNYMMIYDEFIVNL